MKKYILGLSVLISFFIQDSFAQEKEHHSRPNIIFILTDDQRYDALGAAGNNIIHTPNIDSIAQRGVLFRNAYVTTAICCVSRASILTGQYMSRHKIEDFATPFSDAAIQQTYPLLLRSAGYNVGFIGKFGVGAKLPAAALFDYWNCSMDFDQKYYLDDSNGKPVHNTDSVGSSAIDFLQQYAGKEKPFCLSISFKAPHELDGHPPTYPVQQKFLNLYSDVNIPEPLTAGLKYWNSFPDFFRTDNNIGRERWKPLFSTHALYLQTVKSYYRLISGVDDVVGRIVHTLRQLNIDRNTVIIFMGDNGFCLGEHGLQGKWYGFEESIRVPLLLYHPGSKQLKGVKDDRIVLNVDIAPTILSLAGISALPGMQGKSLFDIMDGKYKRDDFFYQHTFLGSPRLPKVEGVVSTTFKYLQYTEHGYEELYDLKNDPHETKNLASDKKYKKQLAQMRERYNYLKQEAK
ncbi:sulfatase family protein [Terrimonas sp.]|uniref:sulfatase family protein n=1 Tax=Terrimonas sp. TaxID=1914338 RepID=UPI0014025CDB|nr:sulfatase [Terrimonas sp.]